MKTKLALLSAAACSVAVFAQEPAPDDPFIKRGPPIPIEDVDGAADPFAGGDEAAPLEKLPAQVGVLLEYIQLNERQVNKLVRKHAASLDATALRGELEMMIDAEEAKLVESTYVKGKSGQRSKVSSALELLYPTEYDPPEIPQTYTAGSSDVFPVTPANPTAYEIRMVGMTTEIEPTVGVDGRTIDIVIAPEIVRHKGREFHTEKEDNLSAVIYQPKFYTMQESTALTVRDGQTVLLSIHRPDDSEDQMLMVLMKVDVLK